MAIRPQEVFYDWHVHEAFNCSPQEIYLPYGSGRLFENYLTWQERTVRNGLVGTKDPRLKAKPQTVSSMSILCAEPIDPKSIADKLTKSFNPFTVFDADDVAALHSLAFTGQHTGFYKISEERIVQAYHMMQHFCATEPSAAAGLALYLDRFDQGKVDKRNKVLVINTGSGF